MTAARRHAEPATVPLRDQVAGEVRATLARQRISGAELARLIGRSQSFMARRLDGRAAFDIDDLELVASVLGVDVTQFFPSFSGHPTSPAGRSIYPT